MKRDLNVIGIDIAKRVFHVIDMDKRGTIILCKRLYRGIEGFPYPELLPLFLQVMPHLIEFNHGDYD